MLQHLPLQFSGTYTEHLVYVYPYMHLMYITLYAHINIITQGTLNIRAHVLAHVHSQQPFERTYTNTVQIHIHIHVLIQHTYNYTYRYRYTHTHVPHVPLQMHIPIYA